MIATCATVLAVSAATVVTQAAPAHATTGVRQFEESGTFVFTVPVGVTGLLIDAWGAGGGGGGASTDSTATGGGGGAGGYVHGAIDVLPLEQITITVGFGGSGGALGMAGTDGGATSVTVGSTAVLTAEGGHAGQAGVGSSGGAEGEGGAGVIPAETPTGGGGYLHIGDSGEHGSGSDICIESCFASYGGSPGNLGSVNPNRAAEGGDSGESHRPGNSGHGGLVLVHWSF